jgi:ABC-type transport system involved in multi-copper enzyme maturation permease subunit
MGGLLRAELRKTSSTKLWWALLIPVAGLSILINLFGGLFTAAAPVDDATLPLLLGSLAYALGLTTVFAALQGIVAAAGEFRHRTITTTYLTAPGRGRVLLAKMAVSGATGALYAAVAVLVGVLAGLAGQAGTAFPGLGPLLAVTAIGMVVAALWSALGAALGTAIGNQVGALVGALVYMLLGELLLSALLNRADSPTVPRLTPYLPVNAGDIAIYDIPARVLAGPEFGPAVVETLAGVTAPPPWWGAVLVLAAWTAAAAATAWVVGGRRDVT